MATWVDQADFLAALELQARAVVLSGLGPAQVARGTVLFRPGDEAQAFVVLVSGRIGVYLIGRNGREMLLYSVSPGQTCVQTTLGVLGRAHYTGEAIAETDLSVVMEQVAFVSVGQRLARALLERAGPEGEVTVTHQELAVIIGSAREVVSRRLEALSSEGMVESERGRIRIRDRAGLQRLAGEPEAAL